MSTPVFYYAPNACSLAAHITLHEAGLGFEPMRVDLATRRTERGEDFVSIHAKGYVPALVLEGGQLLSENGALLDWLSQRASHLKPADDWARTRQIEMLGFLSTQVHKPFVRLFFEEDAAQRSAIIQELGDRLGWLALQLGSRDHVLGRRFGVSDALLYVMERWATMVELPLAPALAAHAARVEARPAVLAALAREGLDPLWHQAHAQAL
jgi:glutathione S-transferase